METNVILRSFGTHDGTFHADEVTACALLAVFHKIDRDKIVRSRDMGQLASCEYVCDVGGVYAPSKKRFDHHQVGYQGELSSAGMILEYLNKTGLIEEKLFWFLKNTIIVGIDAHDNGRVAFYPGTCTFSHVISNFVPIEYDASSKEQTQAFLKALDFAIGHLERTIARFHYAYECQKTVLEVMKERKKVMIFEKALPWMDAFFEANGQMHPAEFVIMPSGSHWKLRGIPPTTDDRMKVRHPLPEPWAGLLGQQLQQITGIEGAIFCHKGRFISVWQTKEDALKALKLITEGQEK